MSYIVMYHSFDIGILCELRSTSIPLIPQVGDLIEVDLKSGQTQIVVEIFHSIETYSEDGDTWLNTHVIEIRCKNAS